MHWNLMGEGLPAQPGRATWAEFRYSAMPNGWFVGAGSRRAPHTTTVQPTTSPLAAQSESRAGWHWSARQASGPKALWRKRSERTGSVRQTPDDFTVEAVTGAVPGHE